MASDIEIEAKDAFIDDRFELALELYSQAIELNPNNADLYADRTEYGGFGTCMCSRVDGFQSNNLK
ncbi:Tetratricopeptide-like helical [Corchorus olitorius]|uniref:Tetratricopeptide-like helical n=1 Tax=Corchorus olitorius TaxID=93759 RepID=A0A1R3HG95_9ROSI|nr:Tetratricopeptide-like helical [Corchorus olitorius]